MSEAQQTTLHDVARTVREDHLVWTPDSPVRGPSPPAMHGPTVRAYAKDPKSLPYQVPTRGSKELCRAKHRTWWWITHQFKLFVCPNCDRGISEIRAVHLHHIDADPSNGDPSNLVALCQRCHGARHGSGLRVSNLSVEEWREEFAALGGGAE